MHAFLRCVTVLSSQQSFAHSTQDSAVCNTKAHVWSEAERRDCCVSCVDSRCRTSFLCLCFFGAVVARGSARVRGAHSGGDHSQFHWWQRQHARRFLKKRVHGRGRDRAQRGRERGRREACPHGRANRFEISHRQRKKEPQRAASPQHRASPSPLPTTANTLRSGTRPTQRLSRSARSASWRLYAARSMSVMRATPVSIAAATTAAGTSTARRSSKGRGMM